MRLPHALRKNSPCTQFLKVVIFLISPALTVALVFIFVWRPMMIAGSSMEPTIHEDDRVLCSLRSYRSTHHPKRGDIIILYPPTQAYPGQTYIKRIMGLPGEIIDVDSHGSVTINGNPLDEPYLSDSRFLPPSTPSAHFVIPQGSYYVLGDHRESSNDSRNFGPISADRIMGKSVLRYWPSFELF